MASEMIDLHADIGYSNFLYAVEEFMHLFNKLRYHPLIYKFNGLKKEEFNIIFTNTPDFRYISEIDMATTNADFDDETEIHDEAEKNYTQYTDRSKDDDFGAAKPLSYLNDNDFIQQLALESNQRKNNKKTKMIEGLMADFRRQ